MSNRLVNGIAADYISVQDRGLQYGDGVFETIAFADGRPQLLQEHLERMREGASRLGISFPGEALFIDDIASIQSQSGSIGNAVIKLILTRGGGRRGYRYDPRQPPTRICLQSAWPEYTRDWKQGIRACFCSTPVSVNPLLAGIKHLNRLDNVLASAELDGNCEEGFMMDTQGNVIEGTMSNVFAVIDDVLVTPDLTHCGIRGIIRDKLLQIAASLGLATRVRVIGRQALSTAAEIFICNSVLAVCPVTRIDGYQKQSGEITRALGNELDKLLRRDVQVSE